MLSTASWGSESSAIATIEGPSDAQLTMKDVIEGFLIEESSAYGDEVEVEFLTDTRKFPDCPDAAPYLANPQKRSGRVSVAIRCTPDSRTKYVSANLRIYIDYVIAAAPLDRDQLIRESDLEIRREDSSRVPQRVFRNIDSLTGKVSTRSIRQGRAVQTNMVREVWLVEKGDSVTLIAQGNGFRITREGQAMDNGAEGETVRIKTDNGKVIKGKVTATQEVQVNY